jgi:protein O-mannosyl-transferase
LASEATEQTCNVPTPDGAPSGSWDAWGPVLAILIVSAIFLPTATFDFTNYDDDENVWRNPYLSEAGLSGMVYLWTHPYSKLYIPLTYTSYVLDRSVWGLDPAFFHVVNVLLHAGSTILVFLILRPLVRLPWVAALGATVFGIHPIQVEAVAWVTGRKDVLSGFFALLSIHEYLSWRRTGGKWRYGLGLAAFGAALLAKPSAVVVPLMAVVLDALGRKRSLWQYVKPALPWLAVSGIWALIVTRVQPPEHEAAGISYVDRGIIAGDALIFYAGKIAWPHGLSPIYARNPAEVLAQSWVPLAPLILAAACGLAWWAGSRWVLCAALFIAGVLPVLGLVPFTFQGWSTVADRYVYLSMVAVALAAAWVIQGLQRSIRESRCAWVPLTAVAIVLLLGFISRCQSQIWQNSLTLWKHAERVCPTSELPPVNRGSALAEAGEHNRAIAEFSHALAIDGSNARAENNIAYSLLVIGRPVEAEVHYRRSVELNTRTASVHYWFAITLAANGKDAEAVAEFAKATSLGMKDPDVFVRMATSYAHLGRASDAMKQYRLAVGLDPKRPTTYVQVAAALAAGSQWESAVAVLKDGLAAIPDDVALLTRLAWIYATCPDAEIRRPSEATRLAERANALTDSRDPVVLDAMAAAAAASGRFEDAITLVGRAAGLAASLHLDALASEIRQRAALYAKRQAYRSRPSEEPSESRRMVPKSGE